MLSAFASAAETALAAASRIRIKHLADDGNRNARRIEQLRKDPGGYIATILVVNTLAIIIASSVATVVAIRLVPQHGELVSAVLLSLAVLIFSEITPKTLSVQNPERAALALGGFVSSASFVLRPILSLLALLTNGLVRVVGGGSKPKNPFVTEEELRMLVTVGEEEGILEEDEKEMIHSIFEFGDKVVREVMKPRVDILGIAEDASFSEMLQTAIDAGHSRIPVYRDRIDNIIGVLYSRDLLPILRDQHQDVQVSTLLREPLFVPETMKVDDLFRDMQRRKVHMAIVLDEYGGTAGLVTIEDLLEEIVGPIDDEYDEVEPEPQKLSDQEYIVDARLSIDELNDLLETELASDDVDTVGGLLTSHLGRLPMQNDTVTLDEGVELVVLTVEGHTLRQVKVRRLTPVSPDDRSIDAGL